MSDQTSRRANIALWIVQGLLALLFLFAGGMKQVMPAQALSAGSGLPGEFMRFIGVAEMAGALGLVLPGLLRVRRGLTPAAAVGLLGVMAGATVVSLLRMGPLAAVPPVVVGALLVVIARGRRGWARSIVAGPVASESPRARLQRPAA